MTSVKTIKNSELFADVERIVSEGGNVRLRVKGGSMRPFLRDGRDAVELTPTSTAALRRGMVVLFRYGGVHVLHRIRRVDGNRLTIKGDGNYRITEIATCDDVVAIVGSIVLGGRGDGRRIAYGSCRWRILTLRSLTAKLLRTAYIDAALTIKGSRR